MYSTSLNVIICIYKYNYLVKFRNRLISNEHDCDFARETNKKKKTDLLYMLLTIQII